MLNGLEERILSLKLKGKVYMTCVRSAMVYGTDRQRDHERGWFEKEDAQEREKWRKPAVGGRQATPA